MARARLSAQPLERRHVPPCHREDRAVRLMAVGWGRRPATGLEGIALAAEKSFAVALGSFSVPCSSERRSSQLPRASPLVRPLQSWPGVAVSEGKGRICSGSGLD
jgi:hypothetical protein